MRLTCKSLQGVGTGLLLLVAMSCSEQKAVPEPVLRPVRAEQVFSTGKSRVRTFSGVARANVEARISFKVAGTLRRLDVEVGDVVASGQVIAELDPEDYRIQVQDAEASYEQAKAQERNASANYERVRDLYENRNASKQDLENARAQYESAVASVASRQQKLQLARNQLEYTRLTAPIAGSVAMVDVEVNENVSAGQTVVLLTSESDLEVAVAIPEILIAQIREGDEVTVTFSALPGRAFPGTVTEVGVAATGLATTFPVAVRLRESDPAVRSGMAAEVAFHFESQTTTDRFYVPLAAVGEDRQGRFVFVVEASGEGVGVVTRRSVVTGELGGTGIAVLGGLDDGDYVVTAGVSKLTDNQRVKFTPPGEGP